MLCSCFSTTMAAALWLLLVAAAAAATASVGAESQEQDMDYANYPDEQDLTLELIKELVVGRRSLAISALLLRTRLSPARTCPRRPAANAHVRARLVQCIVQTTTCARR